MKGAQMFVVRQVAGKWAVEERYSTDYSAPAMQSSQQVELAFAYEDEHRTSWGILLPISTCTNGNRYPIEDISQSMLYAAGSEHDFTYHGTSRTQFHVNLISGPEKQVDSSSYPHVDIVLPGVRVEGAVHSFVCTIQKASEVFAGFNLSEGLQAAVVGPRLIEGTAKYVHHMTLWGGRNPSWEHGQILEDCVDMLEGVTETVWAWAVGAEEIVLPADVALPMRHSWYVLQIHY